MTTQKLTRTLTLAAMAPLGTSNPRALIDALEDHAYRARRLAQDLNAYTDAARWDDNPWSVVMTKHDGRGISYVLQREVPFTPRSERSS